MNAAIFGVLAVASDIVMQADFPGWVYVVTATVWILVTLGLVIRRYQTVSV